MKKFLLFLCALLGLSVSGAWAQTTTPLVDGYSGKTFTLQCARGYVYYDGTQERLCGTNTASQASEFAVVSYDGNTYLYDATQKAFVCHATAATAGTTGNSALESKTDFSKIAKNFSIGATNIGSYPYYIQEDEFGNWFNMDGSPNVYLNTWTNFEGGNGGNTYKIEVVDTDFDQTEAVAMLDAYYNPSATVTYVISDASSVIYTSEAFSTTIGATISSVPADLQRPYCTYSVTSATMVAGANTVNATVTYNPPFTVSSSFETATWYYATLRGSKYVRADESQKDGSGRYTTSTTNEKTDVYKWAFVGNAYNLAIMNKGAGSGKVLYAGSVPVMQAATPESEINARWVVSPNTNGGFTVRSESGPIMYINDASNAGNLGYWNNANGANDAGSNWVITEVVSEVEVTYNVVLGNRTIATASEIQNVGGAPAVPASLNYPYTTYSYDVQTITDNTTVVTATPEFNNMPFDLSADYTSAKWYFLQGHATYSDRYVYTTGDNNTNIGFKQGKEYSDAYKWAFLGNPIEGIQIINKATGDGYYINNTNPASMGTTAKAWTLKQQTATYSNTNGNAFGLYDGSLEQPYLNCRQSNIQYWSAFDQGSTFWVEEAPDIVVTVTYQLVDNNDVISTVEVSYVAANSEVNIPSSLTAKTYYDYTTSGTIGTEDCTITVTRTLKDNVVIDLNGLSNDKCYNIRNNRGTWAVGSGATDVNSTTELNLAFQATDTKQQFAIISYGNDYYLYSVGENKFAYVNDTKLSLTAEVNSAVESSKVTFVNSTSANYANSAPTVIQVGGNSFGVSTGKSPDVYKYSPHLDDDGNASLIEVAGDFDPTAALAALEAYFNPSYTITYQVMDEEGDNIFTSDPVGTTPGATITELPAEYKKDGFYTYNTINITVSETNTIATFTATPKENPLVKYTTDADNPVWYRLKLKDVNYPTYVADVADGQYNVQTPTTDANDETVQWAFIGKPYAGFQIINRAAGANLVLGSATTIGINDTGASVKVSLAAAGSQENDVWFLTPSDYLPGGFFIYNGDGHALNLRATDYLAYWTNGADAGSTFTVTEVLEGEALFNSLIAQLKNINFGTGANQFSFTGDYAGYTSQAETIISGIETQGFSAGNLAIVQDFLANYALNMPSAGFYRIKGNTSSKYLAAGMASNGKFAMSDATDATTIFYYDGIKLTNFGSGMCNGMNKDAWAWVIDENASAVEFQDGLTNGGYAIKSATCNFYDNGDGTSSADRGADLTINSGTNARYTSWYLETVSELPIALNNGGDGSYYATLCLPFAVDIEGATAYTLTKNGAALDLSEGGTAVDGGTPVLLIGTGESATATITSSNAPAEVATDGTLVGTYLPITFDGDVNYVLGKSDNKVGFYHWYGETLKGFRAYIAGEAAAVAGGEVKGYYLNFDIATQIHDMVGAPADKAAYYDLSGRRVAQPTRGLYIVNGKKVAVK